MRAARWRIGGRRRGAAGPPAPTIVPCRSDAAASAHARMRRAGRSVHPRRTHPANISTAVEAIQGPWRQDAIRQQSVCESPCRDEPGLALTMAKSMAAGYYEYSPTLFDPPRSSGRDRARRRSSGPARLSRFPPRPDLRSGRAVVPAHECRRRVQPARGPGRGRDSSMRFGGPPRSSTTWSSIRFPTRRRPTISRVAMPARVARGAAARATRPAALVVRRDALLHANLRFR
jgi:hypothetical protein